jgi:hypothetical protein
MLGSYERVRLQARVRPLRFAPTGFSFGFTILPLMNASSTPKPYEQWRTTPFDRAEDAAYTFGYHLMQHCRTEALKAGESAAVPASTEEFQTHVAAAVDLALHNMMDLLEGFWRTQAGSNYRVEYALSVCVKDADGKAVERIDISPCLLDLPIGYWKWKDGGYR